MKRILMALAFVLLARPLSAQISFRADAQEYVVSSYLGTPHGNSFYRDRVSLSVRFRPCLTSWLCGSGGYLLAADNALRFKNEGSLFRHRALGVEVRTGPIWWLPSFGLTDATFPGRQEGYYGFEAVGFRWDAGPGVALSLERVIGLFNVAQVPTLGEKRTIFRVGGPIGKGPVYISYMAIETVNLPHQPAYHFWTGSMDIQYGRHCGPFLSLGSRSVISTRDAVHNEDLAFLSLGWRLLK